jgi:parallel beta-helix repeat protein
MNSRVVTYGITALVVLAGFVVFVDLGSQNAEGTNVSGPVFDGAGGPWTVLGSPYVFKSDVVVPADQILTIEPGATVHFEKYYNLTVDGYLSANGTEVGRITFKSKPPTIDPGEWGSIRINASGHASIRYSDIMHGDDAIHLLSDGNTIRDCNITTNVNGINIESTTGNIITRNNFTNNEIGVRVDGSSFNDVTYNSFSNNTQYDVNLFSSANSNTVTNNTMRDSMWGVRLYASDNNTISGNDIATNLLGIMVDGGSRDNRIRENDLYNSTFQGIMIKAASTNITVINNTIELAGNCTYLQDALENLVTKNTMLQCDNGIRVENVGNNTLTANNISGSTDGIYIYNSSHDNNVTGNNLTLNGYGITISTNSNRTVADGNNISSSTQAGVRVTSSHFISVSGNLFVANFNGVSVAQSSNVVIFDNRILNGTGDGITLDTSSVVGIGNNTLWDNNIGIKLTTSSGNTISNNNISHSANNGLALTLSPGNNITWNDIWDNGHAIALSSSNGNHISGNNVSLTGVETIQLSMSSFNNITGNNVSHNTLYGMRIDSTSNNNTVTDNHIAWNGLEGIEVVNSDNTDIIANTVSYNGAGIALSSASGSVIYHNNIIGNAVQASDSTDTNTWNDSYPSGGNYWSDYSPTCRDWHNGSVTPQATGDWDGICDFQLDIDADSTDFYPLKYMWGSAPPTDTTPPTIWNWQPPDTSTISAARPSIGANYTDPSGIDLTSVLVEVDTVDETPSSTVLADGALFVPTVPLLDGPHTIYLEVRDAIGNLANSTWGFTVAVEPTISNLGPGDGTTINDATPTISANYSDNTAIDISTVRLRLNGVYVTPTAISSTGVEFLQGTALPDAIHSVMLEVNDTFGNHAIESWSFTIHTSAPSISDRFPLPGTETNVTMPAISANYSDPLGIDINTVLIRLDGFDVTSQATVTQSGFTFTPSSALAGGIHQVYVEVSDSVGNQATETWNFTVSAGAPSDSDGDGLPDDWEIEHFGNLNETASNDTDDDGLNHFEEYHAGTDPNNPDTDGDGISDGDEIEAGTDPLVPEAEEESSIVLWAVIIVVVVIVVLLLFLFFTGRLKFGRRDEAEGLPPPPPDEAFDRMSAEREIDEALGEVPPPPEDLGEGVPAEGAPETVEGVSAEEYEEVEVVEEPIEEEIVVEEVEEEAPVTEETYEEVVEEEVVVEEEPALEKPEAKKPEVVKERRKPLPLPLWAKRSQAKAAEAPKAEELKADEAPKAEEPAEAPEAEKPVAEEKVEEAKPEEPESAAEPAVVPAVAKPEEPEKAEAKEKKPPVDEKQRLKKIAEEIDEILEFEDEPADADIKKTIKDVPEPKKKKKKRGFW